METPMPCSRERYGALAQILRVIMGRRRPGTVRARPCSAGIACRAGCVGRWFAGANPVVDSGVGAVADFQVGELPTVGVGGEGGEAVPVGVGEAELRAGVRAFLADD